MVDYQSGDYDQHLDVVDILRPLHKAEDKMKYVWRKMGMTGAGPPYRWSEDQLDRVDEVLARLRERFEEMERANRRSSPAGG